VVVVAPERLEDLELVAVTAAMAYLTQLVDILNIMQAAVAADLAAAAPAYRMAVLEAEALADIYLEILVLLEPLTQVAVVAAAAQADNQVRQADLA
jgi:hypothetical protein